MKTSAWLCALLMLCPGIGLGATAAESAPVPARPLLAYLASDLRIPFWDIMARGIRDAAAEAGYRVEVLSADNEAKRELQNTVAALEGEPAGIILSPTSSSAGATILKLANRAGVPVVIADIGTDGGEYVSYISSDNRQGARDIGRVLVRRMLEAGQGDGRVGIIAIPQKRRNGQRRTAGFLEALDEAGIKGADIRQQVDFSHDETYRFSRELIDAHPDLRAIWLQGSDRWAAARDAVRDAGRESDILLVCFDAEPEFLELIPGGVLVGAAMQQPWLMGREAVRVMVEHLQGRPVPKNIEMEILAVSADNIDELLPVIRRNVLGQVEP